MKAVIQIGYRRYVMEAEDALVLAKALANSERYEKKWRDEKNGGTSYHIWAPNVSNDDPCTIELLSDNLYRLAKLAGEPEREAAF
jgi:hypothetical protein